MPLTRRIALVTAVAYVSLFHRGLVAQSQQTPQFETATASILVDVVVKDRHGAPVTDLTAADVTVAEDGVPQAIDHFRAVRSDDASPPPAIIALAFEPLQSEAQALANRGVEHYLETLAPNDYTGVFRVGDNLETLQTFTTDPEAIRRAVQRLGGRTASAPTAASMPASTPSPNRSSGGAFTWTWEQWIYQGRMVNGEWVYDVLVSHDRWERTYGSAAPEIVLDDREVLAMLGRADARLNRLADAGRLRGLLALVDALSRIPGRKTILFFAAGEGAPSEQSRRMRDSIVESANRANVAIYTLDAVGLRIHRAREEMAAQLEEQSKYAPGILERNSKKAWTTDLENNERILQEDATTSLTVLAERTGGLAIADTNDFRKGLQAIAADRHSYYFLRYTPKNTTFNGEYRRIAVKIPRRDLVVRGRAGYLAVAAAGPGPFLADEAPALAALAAATRPIEIPVQGTALSVPRPRTTGRVALLVTAGPGAITYSADRKTYRTDFTVLGLIRNGAGEAVEKVSQRFQLTGPSAKIDEARRSPVLFLRHRDLDEGTYTLDYVIYDAVAKKAGTGTTRPFVVSGHDDGAPAVGSLILLRRAEHVRQKDADESNPLLWDDLLLYPAVEEPVSKAQNKTVSFFLPVVPKSQGVLSAHLELFKEGQAAGATPLDVPQPDATGKLAIMGQLPIEALPPGDYSLKATVRHGESADVREARFTVTN